MSALSQSELYGDGTTEPLSINLEKLNQRKEHLSSCNSTEMFGKKVPVTVNTVMWASEMLDKERPDTFFESV